VSEPLNPGEQGSVEWLYSRVGKGTASRFKDAILFLKSGKESAKRYDYRMELVVERLTDQPSEHYVSEYMAWGSGQEKSAGQAYERRSGNLVMVPGFIDHPTVPMCGGSPDGLIDDDGIIEIKAPTSATHIDTLMGSECEHVAQIQGNLWITGRAWCDFVSFDPRLPAHLQLYVQRILRDDIFISRLEIEVVKFLAEVDAIGEKLARKAA
jgi:hypothetical protein